MASSVLNYLPVNIANVIGKERVAKGEVIEIRMRIYRPLQLITYTDELFPLDESNNPLVISPRDLEKSFMILVKNSYYALERQLAEGFLTILAAIGWVLLDRLCWRGGRSGLSKI